MKKMKNLVLLSISLFVAFVFAACSADSEDGMGANGMNEFSAEELQQIYQMQEDYGVSFDFPKKSDKPLPSMKELEEVCQIADSLQASTKHLKKIGTSLTNHDSRIVKTRGFGQGMEYSGKCTGTKSIGSVAIVYYSLDWNNVDKDNISDFTYSIDDIICYNSSYSVTLDKFTYSYSGSCHINYTFTFDVNYLGRRSYQVDVSDSVYLEGYRRS